jgi:hypothetical protein
MDIKDLFADVPGGPVGEDVVEFAGRVDSVLASDHGVGLLDLLPEGGTELFAAARRSLALHLGTVIYDEYEGGANADDVARQLADEAGF